MAYQAEDGSVYFAIDKFPGYGKLSRLDTREVKSGARVLQDDYTKENAQDFALWKAAKPEDEAIGRGVGFTVGPRPPGLASRVLGHGDATCSARRSTFTAAASTSIFPHHEDEIAQSEAATGKTVLALLVPRRVPADRRRQDGEARRERDAP